MEEKRENGNMPENNEENTNNKPSEKEEEKEQLSSFYIGQLPDKAVRGAYDPFNGKDPAVFLAQLMGEEDEEEEKPDRSGWLAPSLAAVLVLLCIAAFLVRSPRLYPEPQPTPTPTPRPTAAPRPTPEAQVLLPVMSGPEMAVIEPAAQGYERTALVVDERTIGVLVSHEAAAALLNEVCDYFEAQIREEYEIKGELRTTIDNVVEFLPAPETADDELSSAEELFETLCSKNTRLDVITTETATEEEIVSAKTKESDDKYLLKGTSIIEDPGRDGKIVTTRSVVYKNGRRRTESEQEKITGLEARDRIVRVGTQKIKDDDEPGRREGKKGREAEDLSFVSPLEDGEVTLNYGQSAGILHLGLDYSSKQEAARVLAACGGTVVCKMERGGYGLMVEIDHGEGFVTRYAHLAEAPVNLGDHVNAGEAIGIMGKSGNADEPHLHFELRIDGEAYNPRYYLD